MTSRKAYEIGTPGKPWGSEEKAEWLAQQTVKRSYFDDVVDKIDTLEQDFDVERYGTLPYQANTYPLYLVKSRDWDASKPVVLVTGGVHGYETSGVHGALRFLETKALDYARVANVIVAPCISPWGYETINRWNPLAIDPNRSFVENSPARECRFLLEYMKSLEGKLLVHIDLHETTDTDNSEFRPALAAREGTVNTNWNIPDGFYLVADADRNEPGFQQAIIESVEKVTHIAEPDEDGKLIGVALAQHGVINYAAKNLGLCMGLTNARYVTTTEVYPDSEKATPEQCIQAQVAAITGGLDEVLA
ncbi:peptidase [Pseudidiomarina salinarum]|uniref:Peptidase n=1 Tax=Pseudidiomarina salinarum TaxID=435908 RepID=A0A094L8B4_9GAMM|nr:M14 family metallocarboxypeptidase [Pseudidiomarina salinarum]KFZ31053.1 peptidase [Pseudidiomarina salinarum]RUO71134.1 peptidase [Pseudidiomarina salinarum]